ncbi:MAG TPA: DUF1460 domain-containing protein [Candidatus Enterousia avicola]|uniref:DUF1460 domain-containing protein n=1 Tax=Candidatus Enterousia avicola TaxID=2840787 RepID=A0A9D1MSI5_9PROT|nr:DUF1460 domain-containing protein [Candidatus Enterousia avicola]
MVKWLISLLLLSACCVNNDFYSDFSRTYVGTRYLNDPLGEEKLPDKDPLIRFDAFDCTTFVETVLAGGDVDKLTDIRYKNGKVDFFNRNHFIETDWLQNNSDLVENVSNAYGKVSVRTVTIDKQNWLKAVHKIYEDVSPVTIELEYISYDDLKRIDNKETLIVLFISGKSEKSDKIGTDLAVVHMGLLLPGGVILRHASSKYGYVMDADFYDYVAQRAKSKNNIGIMLVRIK